MRERNTAALVAVALVLSLGTSAAAGVTKEELRSISTPDSVQTPIGTLKFFDGVPTDDTVETVYDNLDRMRGVEVFLDTLPGASMYGLRAGNAKIGVDKSTRVSIFSQRLDSKSLYLTGNTSTLYAQAFLDTETDGPTVIEVPPGMLTDSLDPETRRLVASIGIVKGQPFRPDARKSWFTILRMYGPLAPWIDKTWRPSEIELLE